MTTLKEYLKNFYQNNLKDLIQAYPGLTLKRLEDELKILCFKEGITENLFDKILLEKKSQKFASFFSALLNGIPLAYISHKSYFFHTDYYITHDVLIPRYETEILVDEAIKWSKKFLENHKILRLVDVGTGSGCILESVVSCLPEKTCQSFAIDISPLALKVAQMNFYLKRLEERCISLETICADRLKIFIDKHQKVDLILSNPPYLKKEESSKVHKTVLAHEPGLALFVEGNYEIWYQEFFTQCFHVLDRGGILFMEGDEEMLPQIKNLCLSFSFQVSLIQDLNGKNRFIKAIKN